VAAGPATLWPRSLPLSFRNALVWEKKLRVTLLPAGVLIWTTTPWTLPANLAIAFHPDYTYVAAQVEDEVWILAETLLEAVMAQAGKKNFRVLQKFSGKELKASNAATLSSTGNPS
jgi:isoleucyl-tRNA synthetase